MPLSRLEGLTEPVLLKVLSGCAPEAWVRTLPALSKRVAAVTDDLLWSSLTSLCIEAAEVRRGGRWRLRVGGAKFLVRQDSEFLAWLLERMSPRRLRRLRICTWEAWPEAQLSHRAALVDGLQRLRHLELRVAETTGSLLSSVPPQPALRSLVVTGAFEDDDVAAALARLRAAAPGLQSFTVAVAQTYAKPTRPYLAGVMESLRGVAELRLHDTSDWDRLFLSVAAEVGLRPARLTLSDTTLLSREFFLPTADGPLAQLLGDLDGLAVRSARCIEAPRAYEGASGLLPSLPSLRRLHFRFLNFRNLSARPDWWLDSLGALLGRFLDTRETLGGDFVVSGVFAESTEAASSFFAEMQARLARFGDSFAWSFERRSGRFRLRLDMDGGLLTVTGVLSCPHRC